MSELKKIIFTKEETEKEIWLNTENPYFNPIKLITYDAEDHELDSKEAKVSSIQYIKHFKENHITGPYLAVEKKDNELLIQNSIDEDWKNIISIKVKLGVEDDFEFDKIILFYQDFNLIENQNSKKDFSTHLEDFKNQKILFSAPFGEGKSTFLNYFFKQHEDNYEVFKVFPVNYSVASNEDIFRYIKADILFQLMGKDVEFKKEEFSTELASQQYVVSNFGQIAKSLLKAGLSISSKTEGIVKAINEIEKLIGGFETFKSEVEQDDESEALKYIKELYEKEGSLFEDNFYTQLIRELVEQIKSKSKSEKETVLIIDDLDRMDPDHIFRILNVISAHCDTYNIQGEEFHNKFGFDKIIVVCDINNIRNIFEHRYGKKVDFEGYIDKFYSSKIFDFDCKFAVRGLIEELKKSIKQNEKVDSLDLLNMFNEGGLLSMRQAIKIKNEFNFQGLNKEVYSLDLKKGIKFEEGFFSPVLLLLVKTAYSKESLIDKVIELRKKAESIRPLYLASEYLLASIGVKCDNNLYALQKEEGKTIYFKNKSNFGPPYAEEIKIGKSLIDAASYSLSTNDFLDLLIENIKLL